MRDISKVGLIGFNDQLNVRHEEKKESIKVPVSSLGDCSAIIKLTV